MSITDLRPAGSNSDNVSVPGAPSGGGGGSGAAAFTVDEFTLTITQIANQNVVLTKIPYSPSYVKLGVMNGLGNLDYGTDYEILGGSIGGYSDIFNAVLNGSNQLVANDPAIGYQSYAQIGILSAPGDSITFPTTPAQDDSWGFLGFDNAITPTFTLPQSTTQGAKRILETCANELLGFSIYESSTSGSQDYRSLGMTTWGPLTIAGSELILSVDGSNRLEVTYNSVVIGTSTSTIPVGGLKMYVVFGNAITLPNISTGNSNVLSWAGKSLDGLLEVGDVIKATYTTANP